MHIQSNIIYNSSNWELEHEWTVNKNVKLKNPDSVISEPGKEIDDYDDKLLLDENMIHGAHGRFSLLFATSMYFQH